MIKSTITNKEIWRIAYPIMLGNLAQTIITFTDTAFLGHIVTPDLFLVDTCNLLLMCPQCSVRGRARLLYRMTYA